MMEFAVRCVVSQIWVVRLLPAYLLPHVLGLEEVSHGESCVYEHWDGASLY